MINFPRKRSNNNSLELIKREFFLTNHIGYFHYTSHESRRFKIPMQKQKQFRRCTLHISRWTRFRSRCQKTSYNSDAKSIFRVRDKGVRLEEGDTHTHRCDSGRESIQPRARKSRRNLPGISMDRIGSNWSEIINANNAFVQAGENRPGKRNSRHVTR